MVLEWIERYRSSSRITKLFILNCIIYGALILGTTAYCYARLEFIRSERTVVKPTLVPKEDVSKPS